MKKLLILTLVLSLLVGFTGLSSAEDIFRLNWKADGLHAPFYLALDKGYYEEEGLDLDIREGTGSGVTVRLLGNKSATFGFADAASVMMGIADGVPVKIIAPIYKQNGFCVLSLKGSNINTIKDLEGKDLGVTPGDALSMLFPGIINSNDLDESKINVVSMASEAKTISLMQGKVDAVLEGADSGANDVKFEGYDVNIMRFGDIGLPTVGLSLLAHEDTIENEPEKIRAFLRATFRGWLEAYNNPEEAVEIMRKYFSDLPADKGLAQLQVALNSVFKSKIPIMGYLTPEEWETHYNILKEYGELETDKPYTDFYDNSLLPMWLPRKPDMQSSSISQ